MSDYLHKEKLLNHSVHCTMWDLVLFDMEYSKVAQHMRLQEVRPVNQNVPFGNIYISILIYKTVCFSGCYSKTNSSLRSHIEAAGMVTHAFNSSTKEAGGQWISVNSRPFLSTKSSKPVRATQ